MKLLLISNSTNAGDTYLSHPKEQIRKFLKPSVKEVLFIPYAAVTFSYDDYEKKVQQRFSELDILVKSIHHIAERVEAVIGAQAIVIGGGNTWQLTRCLHDYQLIDPIRKKVLGGTPFVGWSAGANVACPTIRTTNDMPIVDPLGLHALNFVPFQINPHYLDEHPEGHAGETREQRIQEFIEVNPNLYVVGLREGTMLEIHDLKMELTGPRPARIFRRGDAPFEVSAGGELGFLLANYAR
ncbi:MAG: dipeptidase PepE [Bacteroidales bacterium]|jgi:dipeptidase E